MGSLRFLLVLIAVLVLASLSGWWLNEIRKRPAPGIIGQAAHYDYFLTNFSSTVIDANGKLTYQVKAAHMEHYPLGNRVTLEQPEFTFIEDNIRWLTTSQQAEVFVDDERMVLQGQVILLQQAGPRAGTTLHTDRLLVDAKAQTAETPSEVKIISGKDTIKATGMKADLAKGQLELLKDVHGQYHIPANR